MFRYMVFLICLFLMISGCNFYTPMGMPMEIPDGPPEFKAGWRDGCITGIATGKYSNSSVYSPTFGSGIYQHDKIYQRGWSSAFYTCYVIGNRATHLHMFKHKPFQ
jgi:hypothetical protein